MWQRLTLFHVLAILTCLCITICLCGILIVHVQLLHLRLSILIRSILCLQWRQMYNIAIVPNVLNVPIISTRGVGRRTIHVS